MIEGIMAEITDEMVKAAFDVLMERVPVGNLFYQDDVYVALQAALSARPASAGVGVDKIMLLLRMIEKAGGEIDASDDDHSLLNYFCDDAEPVDTFNQAVDLGYLSVAHDNRFDSSTATLTDKGTAALLSPARAGSKPAQTAAMGAEK
jgi:hypothetical protein